MERRIAMQGNELSFQPNLYGLLSGFLFIVIYFVPPYRATDQGNAGFMTTALDQLLLDSEPLVISATALSAAALFFASRWLYGIGGAAVLTLWAMDYAFLLTQSSQISLQVSWFLFPVAGLIMVKAGLSPADCDENPSSSRLSGAREP